MSSNPFDDTFEQLAKVFEDGMAPFAQAVISLADSITAVLAPKIEALVDLVKFTIDHLPELADKLHEDAGRPYGEGTEASLRWLQDKLQEWQNRP